MTSVTRQPPRNESVGLAEWVLATAVGAVLAGIVWIGLLYYFNFVQVPAVGEALGDEGGPGPAAINKYVAPRALLWFRWGAVATWLTGVGALENLYQGEGSGFIMAFTLQEPLTVIGIGAWLGTIMLFNVWVLIWPNQKKILGIVEASAAEIDFIFEVADNSTANYWVSIVNAQYGVPMGCGTTAVSAPQYFAFVASGQFVGLLGGMKGAAEYEIMVGHKGTAVTGMGAQSLVHLLIIGLVLLGNLGYFMTRKDRLRLDR